MGLVSLKSLLTIQSAARLELHICSSTPALSSFYDSTDDNWLVGLGPHYGPASPLPSSSSLFLLGTSLPGASYAMKTARSHSSLRRANRPKIFGIFIAYICGVAVFLSLPIYELQALRLLMRLYEQAPALYRVSIERKLIRRIQYLQHLPVYVWVKTDDVSLPYNRLEGKITHKGSRFIAYSRLACMFAIMRRHRGWSSYMRTKVSNKYLRS